MTQDRRAWLVLPLALPPALLAALALAFASPLGWGQGAAEPIRLAFIEGLSGAFGKAGEAVFRNLLLATERVNRRDGVRVAGTARPLLLQRLDCKGSTEEAVALLRWAFDQRIGFVLQGNSSATAAALIDALAKHNEREPQRRALFLNDSAVDPALTNECFSFWHFRFGAHADMRLAVLTAKWGNDLTLLVRALRKVGSDAKLHTSYGNALGAPAVIGEAGIGRVLAVAEWHPNGGGAASDAFYADSRQRFTQPQDDHVHVRIQLLVEMLAAAIERAGSAEAAAVARALGGLGSNVTSMGAWHAATMRAADHQLQQPLVVSQMERAGSPGVPHDVEGSGFGFRTVRRLQPAAVAQAHSCRMSRPDRRHGACSMRAATQALPGSKSREAVSAGLGRSDVLACWFCESDEVMPEPIRRAAAESLLRGETCYSHNLGLPELRQAIAASASALHGPVAVDPVVTPSDDRASWARPPPTTACCWRTASARACC